MHRVLIVHPEGNAANNPTLRSIISLLGKNGVFVDIISKNGIAPQPAIANVRWINEAPVYSRLKALATNIISSDFFVKLLIYLNRKQYKNNDWQIVIGVDRQGLIEAREISRMLDIPYAFISFEIMFESETSLRFKIVERTASKNVSFWIAQDEMRAKMLSDENHLQSRPSLLIPVSSHGIANQTERRLRDSLNIPNDKKVAIAVGSISEWTMMDEVLGSLPNWPEDWVLIIHDRYGHTQSRLNALKLEEKLLSKSRLYLSTDAPEDVDDMGYILSGVDCGLAFYRPINGNPFLGNNIRFLGRSSGKIATYLRFGIPVITNIGAPMMNDIREYQLGEVISDPNELPRCLRLGNFSNRKNCQNYFKTHLDFENHSDEFWKLLEKSVSEYKNQ